MGHITLHPTEGVNAHLTFCRRCGGDTPELMLIGNRTGKYRCRGCDCLIYGHRPSEACPKCKNTGPHEKVGTIEHMEKLPSMQLCETCQKEVEEHRKVVEAGGIYFKCRDCNASGVIKANEFTARVREAAGIETPKPVGVEFTNENCPQCGPKENR